MFLVILIFLCILHSFVAHKNLIVTDVTIAVQDDSENRSFSNIAEDDRELNGIQVLLMLIQHSMKASFCICFFW
jgi:hypothetical protein